MWTHNTFCYSSVMVIVKHHKLKYGNCVLNLEFVVSLFVILNHFYKVEQGMLICNISHVHRALVGYPLLLIYNKYVNKFICRT